MITVTIFRSVVDDTKETQRIEAATVTVKEIFPDVDFSNSIISVNGFLQDEGYLLQDGDICTIRLFPEGNGADWLAGLGIGFLVAVTVLNFWNPGGWATAAVLAGGAAAGALGFGIASAAGWSVTGWLASLGANAEDMKSPDALEGIPQLRGAKNQSNYGRPVPLVLGKHLFTPMYVGSPYSTISGIDGEDQYFHVLYMLGYGKLKVNDIKLGVIGDLASNSGNIEDGYLPFDGDPFIGKPWDPGNAENPQLELIQTKRESLLYPQAVVEEPLNIELLHPKGVDPLTVVRFTAKNPMKVQIEITLPSGLVRYNDKGDKENMSVKIGVRWRISRPDNSDGWKAFAQFGQGQSGISYDGVSTTITKSKTKVMRFVAERTYSSYSQVSDADTAGFDTRVIELEIVREDEQSDSAQAVDRVYLTAVRTWLFDNEKSKQNSGVFIPQVPVAEKLRDRTARLGFCIKATQNTQGMIDALNCVVESKCREWNSITRTWSEPDWDIASQSWAGNTETESNNPAAVALKLLQSPSLGRKAYTDAMIDMESFGDFYEWCAVRKYTVNGVLTAGKRLDEVLALVLSTGRATRILNGNKYGLLIDKPREYPVMVLNSQNVLDASNQKGFDDLPDGYLIRYVNKDDGYQYTEEYIMADGTTTPQPDSQIENLELPYITDRAQAVKMAWYNLACRHLRPEIWNRKVSVEGYLIAIGDMVEIQDDTIAVGIGEGGIIQGMDIENNVITKIYTDGEFEVADMNKVYGLKIMQADGVNPIKIRTIPINDILTPGIFSNFTVNIPLTPLLDEQVPHVGDIVAFGIYDRITTQAICFGKKENGDGTFDFVFIPYQEGVYNTDTFKPIPPYNPNITTPQKLDPLHQIPPEQITKDDVVEITKNISIEIRELIYRLVPSVNVVKIDRYGNADCSEISCSQYALLTNGMPRESDMTIKYITSESEEEHEYTGPVEVDPEWEYVIFLLYSVDMLLDREEIPFLRGDGKKATVYELLPSVHVVEKLADGTIEPPVVICEQRSKTGDDDVVESGKELYYVTSENSEETPYTGAVVIEPSWEWIEFRLYDDDDNLLDAERVEVLLEGGSEIVIELPQDNISIQCDEYGNPKEDELPVTIKAKAYFGSQYIDNILEKYKKEIITYPGSGAEILSPVGISLYPVSMVDRDDDVIIWELDNAPSGVTINKYGEIKINDIASLDEINEITVRCIFNLGERLFTRQIIPFPSQGAEIFSPPIGENFPILLLPETIEKVLTVKKVLDDVSKGVVNIDHDHETFIFDKFGKILSFQLPFSTNATLYKGTEAIDHAKIRWFLEITNIDIKYSGLIDNAINSITINSGGVITISQNMLMIGTIEIDVCAEYRGFVYKKNFIIKMIQMPDTGLNGVPRYLGKTYEKTESRIVLIHFTENEQDQVSAAVGDYIAYVGPDEEGASNWKKNYCLQWTGYGWAQLDPANSAYTDHYMRALRDITDGAGFGAFSVMIAEKIMAMDVFVNRLEASLIKLRGPGGVIQSDNYDPIEKIGWLIDYMGNAYFNNATIANGLFFEGEIKTGPLSLLNETPLGQEYTIYAGTTFANIPPTHLQGLSIDGTMGSYGKIKRIYSNTTATGGPLNGSIDNKAYAELEDGQRILIAHSWSWWTTEFRPRYSVSYMYVNGINIPQMTLIGMDTITDGDSGNPVAVPQTIQFRYLMSGKTFKLLNLPTFAPEDPNIVWNSNGTLKIGPA